MPALIRPYVRKVYQKGPEGLPPRLRLSVLERFGPDALRQWEERQEEISDGVRARVEAERAEAVARGVQVVVDETKLDQYFQIKVRTV